MLNKAHNITLVLTVIFLAQLAYFYPQLPEQVATHFNYKGEPDGWMSKEGLLIFDVFLLVFILGTTSLMPVFFNNLPNSLINIPNKDYWLATERREETLLRLAGINGNLRTALLLLFIGINHFAFQANIYGENLSNGVWLILGVFLIYTIYWTIELRKTFRL
jgi:uncharacterized membrane protein